MTQPKEPQEPRQFWLDLATRHGDPCDFISEGKPCEIVSSTNIHVIEFSAYQALQSKLEKAEAEFASQLEINKRLSLRIDLLESQVLKARGSS